jgi:hypothetical protein
MAIILAMGILGFFPDTAIQAAQKCFNRPWPG